MSSYPYMRTNNLKSDGTPIPAAELSTPRLVREHVDYKTYFLGDRRPVNRDFERHAEVVAELRHRGVLD